MLISYLDLATDILMLREYANKPESHWALVASSCFLFLGWALHIFCAWFSHAGRGLRVIGWEILIAATYMAPAVGTYRFIVGAEMDKESNVMKSMGPVIMYLVS